MGTGNWGLLCILGQVHFGTGQSLARAVCSWLLVWGRGDQWICWVPLPWISWLGAPLCPGAESCQLRSSLHRNHSLTAVLTWGQTKPSPTL